MIDVTKRIGNVIKGIEFYSSKDAAKIVLGELKTKFVDIREEITAEIQYRLLKKMKADREKSRDMYIEGKRYDLADNENVEICVINALMGELEDELPKMLTEEEIENIIQPIEPKNMGNIMKAFRDMKNVDKALVAKIAKKYC